MLATTHPDPRFGEALAGFFRNGAVDSYKLKHIAIALESVVGLKSAGAEALGRWAAEGAILGSYKFDRLITRKDKLKQSVSKITLAAGPEAQLKKGVIYGTATAEYTAHARDLVNEPSNRMHPAALAKFAQDMARKIPGLTCKILNKAQIEKLKMGAFLAVNAGSDIPAHLIILEWNGGKKGEKPIAFVGKGLTFDSGGYDIKPAAGMEDMKWDMGGAGAVAGAMLALAGRKAKANVIGVCGLVENMPDGKAQRPGDVVTSMSGQTVEVINTDAEGRLVLCDVLTWTQKNYSPSRIVDLATLTGAIIISLGHEHAGAFSNDDTLAEELSDAGRTVGEKLWRLPLLPEYDKLIDSQIADMKNVGPRWGGSITAAQFLQRYIDKGTPWTHLDIAGMAWADKPGATWDKGATGFGVRLLDRFVRRTLES